MPNHSRNNTAYLEGIRLKFGNERLKDVFHDATEHDHDNAARLVNDNIRFPSLFLLRPEISKARLYERLNQKHKQALDISDEILTGTIDRANRMMDSDRTALQWMLQSGYQDDGIDEQYDQVLDTSALLLSRVHKDKACMKPIVEILFNRHRKGFYTYDLTWAFFEASEPMDLLLVAEKLRSNHPKDRELARNLLNFVPCLEKEKDMHRQYKCCTRWIRHNRNRLTYTGESNQQHNNPRRYALSGAGSPEEDGGGGDD